MSATGRRLRVGVNLLWLVPGVVGGSEESTTRTLRAIAAAAPDDVELVLFAQASLRDAHPELVEAFETHTLPVPGGAKALRVAAERTWLPRALANHDIDVLHDAGGTSVGDVDIPRVLTVHDIQPLEQPANFGFVKVAYLKRMVPRAVAGADVVVVPSGFVRDRLVATLGCPADKIAVVPWCVPPPTTPRPIDMVRAQYGIIGRILLLPAITYPHKEHVVAIRALRHLAPRHHDMTLVMAGGEGPAEQAVADEISKHGVEASVVRLGRVPPEVLAALYRNAEVLVWPSVYEGFGNPVLEAMANGVPVVAADAGASPEVVGDAGALFPPGDDAQLAVELHRVLIDPAWRRRMVDAGLERAATFTPERSAEGLLAAYRSVTARL